MATLLTHRRELDSWRLGNLGANEYHWTAMSNLLGVGFETDIIVVAQYF